MATMMPRIRSRTAKINCSVFPRLNPVLMNALPSLKIVIESAVKVTAIIKNMGIHSINPCLFVFFRNTAQAIRANTDKSWLPEPNRVQGGQRKGGYGQVNQGKDQIIGQSDGSQEICNRSGKYLRLGGQALGPLMGPAPAIEANWCPNTTLVSAGT